MESKPNYIPLFIIFLISLAALTTSIFSFLIVFSFFSLLLGLLKPKLSLPTLGDATRKKVLSIFIPIMIASAILSPHDKTAQQEDKTNETISITQTVEKTLNEVQKAEVKGEEAKPPTPTPVPTNTPAPTSTPRPTSTSVPTRIPTQVPTNTPVPQTQYVAPVVEESSGGYACNCSKTCPNLSCDEAYFQLNQCGCSARDGDNDGVPCEAQCR